MPWLAIIIVAAALLIVSGSEWLLSLRGERWQWERRNRFCDRLQQRGLATAGLEVLSNNRFQLMIDFDYAHRAYALSIVRSGDGEPQSHQLRRVGHYEPVRWAAWRFKRIHDRWATAEPEDLPLMWRVKHELVPALPTTV